jgi:hypothetical protein
VIDWEGVEVSAGDIEIWFASVGQRVRGYAAKTRLGQSGVHVERAGLGEMLLSKADALGVDAREIPSEVVSRGKDLRALSAERFVNGGDVRLTRPAVDRISRLKGVTRNHLLAQIGGFRVADKLAWKRSDDLVDAFVYAVLAAFTLD